MNIRDGRTEFKSVLTASKPETSSILRFRIL